MQRVGGAAARELELFARAHRFSALTPLEGDREVENALQALEDALEKSRGEDELVGLESLVRRRAGVVPALRTQLADRRLLAELEPWLEAYAAEVRRMEIAVEGLRAVLTSDRARDRTLGFQRMEGQLTRVPVALQASFGPRRVAYPQLRSLRDDNMAFGSDPVLYVDRCTSDALVRLVEREGLKRLR